MSAKELTKLQLLMAAWRQTISCMKIPRFYTPFIVYALLQVFILIGFVLFNYFPFSKIFMPIQKAIYGEAALHYPNNFIILPSLFDITNIALSGIAGILVLALATQYFFFYTDKKNIPGGSVREVLRRFPDLFGVWVIETAVILGLIYGATIVSPDYPNYVSFITAGRITGAVVIMAAFAYAIVIIVTEGKRFWAAIWKSFRLFVRYFYITLLMIAVPILILQIPLDLMLTNTPEIAKKLSPEIIPVLIGSDIVFSILLNFMVIGAITFFYKTAVVANEKALLV
ncbi:MAG: hypothetical protein Q9P90_15620 [candidate division KSB1 bacterium]|nr:hypothetical protein [candidate division KSB1 bacterium]